MVKIFYICYSVKNFPINLKANYAKQQETKIYWYTHFKNHYDQTAKAKYLAGNVVT